MPTWPCLLRRVLAHAADVVGLITVSNMRQGVNVTALREIKLLKELRSPHLVQLIDVFPHKHSLLLVRHLSASTGCIGCHINGALL